MISKILLRVAAVLMFIHGVLHTIGFTSWKTDPDRQDVVKAMNGPKLPFMGASRNIAQYYDGFGYATSIALLLIALTLWFVAGELASRSLAKKIILTLAFILLLWGADEIIFFSVRGMYFVAILYMRLCGVLQPGKEELKMFIDGMIIPFLRKK